MLTDADKLEVEDQRQAESDEERLLEEGRAREDVKDDISALEIPKVVRRLKPLQRQSEDQNQKIDSSSLANQNQDQVHKADTEREKVKEAFRNHYRSGDGALG